MSFATEDNTSATVAVIVGLFITTIFNQVVSIPSNSVPWAVFKKVAPPEFYGIDLGIMLSVYLLIRIPLRF